MHIRQRSFATSMRLLTKGKVFLGWNQCIAKEKIARLFFMRKAYHAWKRITLPRRIEAPRRFRERRLKRMGIDHLKVRLRDRWKQQRGEIICRALLRKNDEKLQKKGLLGFLENILQNKKRRMEAARDHFADANAEIEQMREGRRSTSPLRP